MLTVYIPPVLTKFPQKMAFLCEIAVL